MKTITIKQAIKKYKISRPTLYKYIEKWSIQVKRTGRRVAIDDEALEHYIKDSRRVWWYTKKSLFDTDEKDERIVEITKEKENMILFFTNRDDEYKDKITKLSVSEQKYKDRFWFAMIGFFFVLTVCILLGVYIYVSVFG